MKAINLIIRDEDLDKVVADLIKEKVKNMLRNDDELKALIDNTVTEEVKKRVSVAINTDIKALVNKRDEAVRSVVRE